MIVPTTVDASNGSGKHDVVSPDVSTFLRNSSRDQTVCGCKALRRRGDQSDEEFSRLIDEVYEIYHERRRARKELDKQTNLFNDKLK